MRLKSGNLRTRLVGLVLLAVLPLTGLAFYTAYEQRQLEIADIEGDVLTFAEFAARDEAQLLDGTRQLLANFAHYLERQWSDSAECSRYLSELMNQHRRYKNLGAVDAQGMLHCSAISYETSVNVSDRLWFKRVIETRKFAVGDYQIGLITGSPVIVLAYPIISSNEKLLGVAFAALDIQWLNQYGLGIEKSLPNGSTISQIDDHGVVLAQHPESDTLVGRSLANTHLFDAVRSKQMGIVRTEGPDGQPQLNAFSKIFSALGNRNVYMLVGIPENSIYLAANRLLAHNLILLGSVTLIAIVATWFGSDLFVLRQVRAMVGATTRLAKGDLSSRTGLSQGTGELDLLARTFDDMATALERREMERQQAEKELRNSREQLRNLSSHLESVREEERTRLAREIHDELGQALTALKMDTFWLIKHRVDEPDSVLKKIRSMEELLDATIRTVQRLSGELRPGLLDDLGLAAAIEWQAEEFQNRSGIACEVMVKLQEVSLSRDHATAVFRIFQETLTNVIRHAKASRVEVRLDAQGDRLVLEVKDNGRGITENEIRNPKAFGIIGMRERVLALSGECIISGKASNGTAIVVNVPLNKEESHA
jgi:signal transduction histidine kinase